jgi:CHAD domain-containing protein
MSKIKKWEIENLSRDLTLCEGANIILSSRIGSLLDSIKKFFEEETVKNLHAVRIALRRVRYNMELFPYCFDKKKFLIFYKKIVSLQDLSGSVRDLDVLTENMLSLKEEKARVPKAVFTKVAEKRNLLNDKLKLELMKFLHSKALSNFQKMMQ